MKTYVISTMAWCFIVWGLSGSQVLAQTIGSIGIGDVRLSATPTDTASENEQALKEKLSLGLTDTLVKTRKFTVLPYETLKQRLINDGIRLEGYYDRSNKAGDYQNRGLDYILTADVMKLDVFGDDLTGVKKAQVDVDVKLLGVSHGTRDFNISVFAQSDASDDGAADIETLDSAMVKATDKIVKNVMLNLFPIRIMRFSADGSVVLNYGSGVLEAGDVVRVYPKSNSMAQGQTTRFTGTPVGSLQITSTDTKFSTAEILSGTGTLELGAPAELLSVKQ